MKILADNPRISVFIQTLLIFGVVFSVAFFLAVPRVQVFVSIHDASEQISRTSTQFLLWFLAATAIAVTAVRYFKDKRFWTVFFGVGAFAGLYSIAYLLLSSVVSGGIASWLAIPLALVPVFVRLRWKLVWIHNVVVLLTSIGVAQILAWQFQPKVVVSILIILAVYDVIAVYFTKHMISMARGLFQREAFFGVLLPTSIARWKESYAGMIPGKKISVLGAGDIALPLMLALSHGIHTEPGAFWVITSATIVGVLLLQLLFHTVAKGRPMPALPPLVLAAVIGHYIVGML